MKTIIKTSLAIILIMLLSSTFADVAINGSNGGSGGSQNGSGIQDQDRTQDQDRLQDCTGDCDQLRDQDRTQDQDRLQDCTGDCDQLRDQDRTRDRLNILDTSKLYREDIKDNLNAFNLQYGTESGSFSNLNEETRSRIRNMNTEFNKNVEEIKNQYQEKINSAIMLENKEQLREELRIKLQNMVMLHYQDLKGLVGSDEKALAWVRAREELTIKNQDIINERYRLRIKFNLGRNNQVLYFKEKYNYQLGNNIEKISENNPAKLEQILEQIDSMMVNFETNTNLSQIVREKILSQLTALKELIEDNLNLEEITQ